MRVPLLYVLTAVLVLSSIHASAQTKKKLQLPAPPKDSRPDTVKEGANISRIRVKYDEFRDETSVFIGPMPFTPYNIDRPIEFMATFSYPGQKLTTVPDGVMVAFTTYSRPTDISRFQSAPDWLAIIDGQRRGVGRMKYNVSASSGRPGFVAETLSMLTTTDFFMDLIKSSQIKMQVGGIEFTVTESALQLLKDFVGKMSEGLGDVTPIVHVKKWSYSTADNLTRGEAVLFNPTKANIQFARAVMTCKMSEDLAGETTDMYITLKAGEYQTVRFVQRPLLAPGKCKLSIIESGVGQKKIKTVWLDGTNKEQ
jgi:hypothetical protein